MEIIINDVNGKPFELKIIVDGDKIYFRIDNSISDKLLGDIQINLSDLERSIKFLKEYGKKI